MGRQKSEYRDDYKTKTALITPMRQEKKEIEKERDKIIDLKIMSLFHSKLKIAE